MFKILKLIILVSIATCIGLVATQYDGYVIIVVAGMSIKVNLVIACLAVIALAFGIILAVKLLNILLSLPIGFISWVSDIFAVDKKQKLADVVSYLAAANKTKLLKLKVAKIRKSIPKDMQEYIFFARVKLTAESGDIDTLDSEIKFLDESSIIYQYFLAYSLVLKGRNHEALVILKGLLRSKSTVYTNDIVALSVKLASAKEDYDFAIYLIDNFVTYLDFNSLERLSIFIINYASSVEELKKAHSKLSENDDVDTAYASRLLQFGDEKSANKVLKKMLAKNHVFTDALNLYINAFNPDLEKVFTMVCNSENDNYDSILVLLDISMLKANIVVFNKTQKFIDANIFENLSNMQKQKYNHILCRFFIKQGVVSNPSMSIAKIIHNSNESGYESSEMVSK